MAAFDHADRAHGHIHAHDAACACAAAAAEPDRGAAAAAPAAEHVYGHDERGFEPRARCLLYTSPSPRDS